MTVIKTMIRKNLGRCWCCTILPPLPLPGRLIHANKIGICPTFLSHRSSCIHSKTPRWTMWPHLRVNT